MIISKNLKHCYVLANTAPDAGQMADQRGGESMVIHRIWQVFVYDERLSQRYSFVSSGKQRFRLKTFDSKHFKHFECFPHFKISNQPVLRPAIFRTGFNESPRHIFKDSMRPKRIELDVKEAAPKQVNLMGRLKTDKETESVKSRLTNHANSKSRTNVKEKN